MSQICKRITGLCVATTAGFLVGACDASTSDPLSPSTVESVAVSTAAHGAPEPVSPVNGATTPTTQPTFVVNAGTASPQTGSVTYEFEVSADSTFEQIASAFTAPGGPTQSATSGELPPGQTFYWRVRTTDGTSSSAWSAIPTFQTPAPLTLECPPGQTATSADGFPVLVTYPDAVPIGGVAPFAIDYSQPSERFFPVGDHVVTAVASDAIGQGGQCTFTVSVALAPSPSTSGGGVGNGDLDPNEVIWLDEDIRNWPVTSTVTDVRIGAPPVCIEHTKAGKWPNVGGGEGNPWVFAQIDGRWYGATYEWLKPGQTCKGVTREDIGPHTKEPPLESWRPRSGELVGFMVSTPVRLGPDGPRHERSNIVLVRWP